MIGNKDLATQILVGIYDALPLGGAHTEYNGLIRRLGDRVMLCHNTDQRFAREFYIEHITGTAYLAEGPQEGTVLEITLRITRKIREKHPGRITAFVAKVIEQPRLGCVEVIYGIETEEKKGADPAIKAWHNRISEEAMAVRQGRLESKEFAETLKEYHKRMAEPEPHYGKSVIETLWEIRKQADEVLRKINGHPNP